MKTRKSAAAAAGFFRRHRWRRGVENTFGPAEEERILDIWFFLSLALFYIFIRKKEKENLSGKGLNRCCIHALCSVIRLKCTKGNPELIFHARCVCIPRRRRRRMCRAFPNRKTWTKESSIMVSDLPGSRLREWSYYIVTLSNSTTTTNKHQEGFPFFLSSLSGWGTRISLFLMFNVCVCVLKRSFWFDGLPCSSSTSQYTRTTIQQQRFLVSCIEKEEEEELFPDFQWIRNRPDRNRTKRSGTHRHVTRGNTQTRTRRTLKTHKYTYGTR